MASEKPLRSAQPAWGSMAVLLGLCVFFGLFVLPRIRSSHSRLVGAPAPTFTLPVLDPEQSGNRLGLRDLRGKAVVLDFWASWCGPCRQQMPIIDRLVERYEKQGLVVVGVNTDDDERQALEFLRSRSNAYASVFDETREVSATYEVRVLPTLVVIDRQGIVLEVRSGVLREDELEELVRRALGSGPSSANFPVRPPASEKSRGAPQNPSKPNLITV
jgi:cytochrome c biogenesis protein CcmG, thiol:disulfide interchange protein DsbE